ncbi:MAG: hypothetical protein V4708_05795 [Bacteroidota bacterium]
MKYFFLLLSMSCSVVNGQNPGPKFAAMGSGGSALSDVWSLQQNPAGIADLKRPMVAIAFEKHFMDREVSTQTAVAVLPYRSNGFGLSFEKYGFSEFNEQMVGICYAKGFGSFRMSVGLKYYQLSITHYGSANALTTEVGFQFEVSDKFTIASHVSNPDLSKYNSQQELNLPAKFTLGVAFLFNSRLSMIADIRKPFRQPADGMTGIEYNVLKWFSLRGGVSVNPFQQYTGFGINYNKIQVDVSVSSHPSLGYSPQVAIGYEF